MMYYLELLYSWVLAPIGLYMLVKPPVRALLCWLSLRSCVREANKLNPHAYYGAPRLRSLLRYAMHRLPPTRGPTYAWYGFGRWQVWEAEKRTDDSIFDKGDNA